MALPRPTVAPVFAFALFGACSARKTENAPALICVELRAMLIRALRLAIALPLLLVGAAFAVIGDGLVRLSNMISGVRIEE
jgi:hypothetical protein